MWERVGQGRGVGAGGTGGAGRGQAMQTPGEVWLRSDSFISAVS